jgi:hypothetical protein
MKCGKCQASGPQVDLDHVRACFAQELVGAGAQRAGGNGNQWRVGSDGSSRPIRDRAAGVTADDQWRTGNQAGQRRDNTEATLGARSYGGNQSVDWDVVDSLRAQIKPHLFKRNGRTEGSFAIKEPVRPGVPGHVVKFYEINTGKARGIAAGRVFVSACASDDRHLVRNPATLAWVLTEILKDPRAARELYASELGHCYVCHKELTDEESRARGIGPVCAGKYL